MHAEHSSLHADAPSADMPACLMHAQQSMSVRAQHTCHAAAHSGDGDGVATDELVQHAVQPLGVASIADRPTVHACMLGSGVGG